MKRKWYVIKDNNTNEYYDGSSDDDCWTSTINFAYFFYDKSDAEHEKDVGWNKHKFNDDCEIIELCEDDEEYQDLKEYNAKLKQQLAKKDKEIEKLKNFKRDINNALYMDAYDERCGVDGIVLYTALKKDIRRILNELDQIEGEKDG